MLKNNSLSIIFTKTCLINQISLARVTVIIIIELRTHISYSVAHGTYNNEHITPHSDPIRKLPPQLFVLRYFTQNLDVMCNKLKVKRTSGST